MHDDKQYVLVIKNKGIAFGPLLTRDAAEYAAQDYYGTAITGASVKDEFLIVELRPVDPVALSREHVAHVAALLVRDDE